WNEPLFASALMATSPVSVNLMALPTKLISTCVKRRPSPWPGGTLCGVAIWLVRRLVWSAFSSPSPRLRTRHCSGSSTREVARCALRSVIECLAAVVAHHEAGFQFFDRPRRREAEGASGRVDYFRPNKSGSLATFVAIRGALS